MPTDYKFSFSDETKELLDDLIEATELKAGEVICNALLLYWEVISIHAEGNRFQLITEDGKVEEYNFFEEDESDLH